jgi:hypothetical protein
MPVTDEQLEQLEAYMDGELPSEQEGDLLRRLAAEPELAAAMATLRAEREARGAIWQSYEPSDAAVQRLVHKVEQAVDRHYVWANRFARWRIPSAAAACIVFGFLFGWVGRSNSYQPGIPGGATLVAENSTTAPQPMQAPFATPGLTTVNNQRTHLVPAPVDLPIVNEYGQRVGVQRFNSIEEAGAFVEDLSRYQRTQEKVINGNVTLTGVQKF